NHPYVTHPVNNNSTNVRFESPYDPGYTTNEINNQPFLQAWPRWSQDRPDKDLHVFFIPTDLTITYTNSPDPGMVGKTRVFPALVPYIAASKTAGDFQKLLLDPKTNQPLKL